MQNAEGECGMRNFDPMQNAEEECGMRGGEGSGELVGRNEKGATCRGRALHRFMHPHPSSHLISSPHPPFLFCILHRVEIPHPAFFFCILHRVEIPCPVSISSLFSIFSRDRESKCSGTAPDAHDPAVRSAGGRAPPRTEAVSCWPSAPPVRRRPARARRCAERGSGRASPIFRRRRSAGGGT